MLDVALLSSRLNFPFLLLNCTEVVPKSALDISRCLNPKMGAVLATVTKFVYTVYV